MASSGSVCLTILFLIIFTDLASIEMKWVDNESTIAERTERFLHYMIPGFLPKMNPFRNYNNNVEFYLLLGKGTNEEKYDPHSPESYGGDHYFGPFKALEHDEKFKIAKNTISAKIGEKFAFLIHGWTDGLKSFYYIHGESWMKVVGMDWGEFHNTNVILVDWQQLSKSNYYSASKTFVNAVGKVIYDLIALICTKPDKTLDRDSIISFIHQVSVAGHSLGSQIAGYFGFYCFQQFKEKIYRIYALDPAGMNFRHQMKGKVTDFFHVNHEHAHQVYVLHTTTRYYGSRLIQGHYIFYVNGGCQQQPNLTKNGLSHMRAINLFRESLFSKFAIGLELNQDRESFDSSKSKAHKPSSSRIFGIYDQQHLPINSMQIYYMKTLAHPPYFDGITEYEIPNFKVVPLKSGLGLYTKRKLDREVYFEDLPKAKCTLEEVKIP